MTSSSCADAAPDCEVAVPTAAKSTVEEMTNDKYANG